MVNTIKICEGISDISDAYNGFLIDQWGTLHDGEKPYPDAIETLRHLKSRGKQIILISNSGKRSVPDSVRLKKMGFTDDLYDHIVTSSETTRQSLKNRDKGVFADLGNKCFLMNRLNDTAVIDGLADLVIVDDVNDADFILLTGSDAPEKTMENYYDPILKQASRKRIRMVCANPEKIITINGQNYMGSGEIARRFEEFGGVVNYVGKPFPAIFQYALSLFVDLYQSQICVVGDSLANDVRGARYLDMDCALIANGMHRGAFSKVQSTSDIQKVLNMLCKNFGAEPTYFIPRFHWGRELPDRKNKRKKN